MAKIKICGMMSTTHIEWVNEYKPDYVGFIFAKSRRQVSVELASQMKSILDKTIQAVGVFVNEDIKTVAKIANDGIIDVVQLHGDEDNEYIKTLRTLCSVPIVKAIRVKEGYDDRFDADYLLFDTFSKDAYGGTGKMFDKELLRGTDKPFFAAGGINIDNVSDVIKALNPYCIDVSSGVETDGVKDKDKIQNIIEMVRKEQ